MTNSLTDRRIEDLKEFQPVIEVEGTMDYSEFDYGVAVGVEFALASLEKRDPEYPTKPDSFIVDKEIAQKAKPMVVAKDFNYDSKEFYYHYIYTKEQVRQSELEDKVRNANSIGLVACVRPQVVKSFGKSLYYLDLYAKGEEVPPDEEPIPEDEIVADETISGNMLRNYRKANSNK